MSESGAVRRRRGHVIGDGLSGGFWRRVVAFWIDHALVGLVLTLIGAAAFTLTDGVIRHSSPVVGFAHCVAVDEAGSRNTDRLKVLPLAGGPVHRFRPDRPPDRIRVSRCDTFPSHSAVRVKFTWAGQFTWARQFSYHETVDRPLSASGRVIPRTFDLASLFFPVLLIWLAFSEAAWGGGPGKRLMGLRVLHRDGVRRAAFKATLMRNALLYGPSAVGGLAVGAHGLFRATLGGPLYDPLLGWAFIAFGAVAALWGLLFFVSVLVQRPDPFWDRWSGVSVRRRVWIEEN
ncbi:MAG: RDD family protein [Brevundimonas sp.]|uniref:RDD family protein n=1 Tax=Brevundimonas sp. TaxID=1871086 RepID=UPI002735E4F7|nr:RDD family protein [Brevundimonas sp.]MDP3404989.1 RDD family protein [Brevundimonas sp.]